jgi:hypothetical protein
MLTQRHKHNRDTLYIVRANELVHLDLPGDVHNPSDELYLTVKRLAELARCAA